MSNNGDSLELNILSSEQDECCVCLNTTDDLYVELHCCRQHIHKKCLIEWILNEPSIRSKCPICRCVIYSLDSRIEMKDFICILQDILNCQNPNIDKHRLRNICESFYKNEILFQHLFIADAVDDINERAGVLPLTSAMCFLILIVLMINLFLVIR